MYSRLPPTPQTGRQPITLSPEQEKRLLSKRLPADYADPFASDTNEVIRKLGKLALRRKIEDPSDSFVLGDLCALLSLSGDHLRVLYVGKAILAYRRAGQQADTPADSRMAESAVENFVRWIVQVAEQLSVPRNLAVALWVVTEYTPERLPQDLREAALRLADRYRNVIARLIPPYPGSRETHEMAGIDFRELTNPSLDATQHDIPTPPDASIQVELLDTRPDLLETVSGDEDRSLSRTDSGLMPAIFPEPLSRTQPEPFASDSRVDALRPMAELMPGFVAGSLSGEAETEVSQDFRPGEVIANRYEVRGSVRGGMGIVYLCYDRETRGTVAIKTYQGRFLENERAMARFVQEARTWIRLEKHPNIVQARLVKEMGSERVRERPHIVLEYVAGPEGLGPDLKSWIEHRRLDLERTLRISFDICLGMRHAVTVVPGLVHRDLKPGNILVRHDGLAKVTDFGLAHSVETFESASEQSEPGEQSESSPQQSIRLTRAGAVVGTAPYMSPEQCRGEHVDQRSDIYAFGAILYEMLTGMQLFKAQSFGDWMKAHVEQTPAFPPGFSAIIPRDVQTLVLRCLAKNPEQRPQNWESLASELSGLGDQLIGQNLQSQADERTAQAMQVRDLLDQAYSLTELGYSGDALAAHERALALQPDSASAWTSKGRTLRLLNRYDDALAAYRKALEIDPGFAWAWRSQGIILERRGDHEGALAAYRKAAELRPKDVWPVYYQAGILRDMGKHDEALAILAHALEIDPHHAPSYVRQGQVLRSLGRHEEALAAFERAIQIDPSEAGAWDGKGLTLKQSGRADEAVTALMRATRLLPNRSWPWEHLAEALIDLERFADALPALQQALMAAPDDPGLWMRQGQVLRTLGRYHEALAAYERALALQPQQPGLSRALGGKASVLERLGRLDEARLLLERVLETETSDAWTHYNLGNVLSGQERYEEAISQYKCAIRLDRNHPAAWGGWASVLRRQGRLEKSLIYFNRALRVNPGSAWTWNEKAQALVALARYDEAMLAFERAIEAAPNETLYRFHRADTLISMNHYKEALADLEKIVERDPDHQRAWTRMGLTLRRLNRLGDSIRAYGRALEIDPRYAPAWNGQGMAFSALGQHEEALECFLRAASEDPSDVWYWYNQADELLELQRYTEALDLLDQCLNLDEMHGESWAKRGQALRRLGRYKEAVAAYDRAIAIHSHYAWAWNGRGLALEQMNRREEAIQSFERAAAEDPTSPWYWLNQIDPLLALGRTEDALEVCEHAAEAAPTAPVPWARKGQVLRRLNRHEEAIDAYTQAIRLDETYAWAWNGKGLANGALGRWEEALKCYEQAVEADPTDVWFWHNRGESLLELQRYEEAISIFNRALEIDPQHEPSRKKRTDARRKLSPPGS